jgi:UDP-GlcNAc:undecaprenyl-phosphate GlcNAc-1-phosphate transferase
MDVFVVKVIFSFLFSSLITLYLVPFFCALAERYNFVDKPDGKIKVHKSAVPYLGGVAVYGGFLCGIMFTMPFESRMYFLIISITLLLMLGLIDDLMPLEPYQKFFGQMIVALSLLKAGFYLKEHLFFNLWNLPLSFLWILIIINAFNLVDVMDGLATSLAIYATLGFMIIAGLLGHTELLFLLSSFLGALIAFLWYNKPPARIYLGDAGALFIGGFLAVIPFLIDWGRYSLIGFIAPIIVLAIPLLEFTSLILIRSYKRIPFYRGSPDHFSSYLLANGWKKESILIYILAMSAILITTSALIAGGLLDIHQVLTLGLLFMALWVAAFFWK